MGTVQFLSSTVLKDLLYETLNDTQIALFENLPSWYYIVFGIAVITGVLGSILLLMRKKLAVLLFTISLIAVSIQMIYWMFATDVIDVYGTTDALTMPIIVIITALVLLMYSRSVARKGWLS
jgi:glucose dehydrogenase